MSKVAGRQLPAALDRQAVGAEQPRRDLVVDDPVDLEQAGVLVAGVRLAHDPLLGVDARDDRRAVGHVVVAAAVDAAERDPDRDRLDPADRQRGGDGRCCELLRRRHVGCLPEGPTRWLPADPGIVSSLA